MKRSLTNKSDDEDKLKYSNSDLSEKFTAQDNNKITQPIKKQKLSLNPKNINDEKFPKFSKPVEIGSFSQDSNRVFHNDRHQLKFYSPPKNLDFKFDLREGYHTFIKKDDNVEEFLDDLLRWVKANKPCLSSHSNVNLKNHSLNTDFLCFRGLLTKILCSPYERREGWKISAIRFDGTIYLCEFETECKKRDRAKMNSRQLEMMYWGFKFEQFVTTERPEVSPQTTEPVNNKAGFCSVVRTRIGDHSLVYGAEVDCCVIDKNKQQGNYIELKTSRHLETSKQAENFKRFKLLRWWAQSFLIGIPRIVCGFRDDNGVVDELRDYTTLEIPRTCKNIVNPWKPSICFNFLVSFLDYVKSVVPEDNARKVFLIEWSPGRDVNCVSQSDDTIYNFLPDWFTGISNPTRKNSQESIFS